MYYVIIDPRYHTLVSRVYDITTIPVFVDDYVRMCVLDVSGRRHCLSWNMHFAMRVYSYVQALILTSSCMC